MSHSPDQYPQNSPQPPEGQNYPQPNYPQQRPEKRTNVLGLIALIAGVLGFIFACIPGILILGWILLPIAFILGIISLFLRGKSKWMGIVGLILSIVGTIIGVCVFIFVVGSAISDASNNSGSVSEGSSSSDDTSSSGAGKSADSPHFGSKYDWDSGLAVTVGEPVDFTPSDIAAQMASNNSGQAKKFAITVHNGTDKAVDAFGVSNTVQSGGQQGEAIFDSENGISTPEGNIQPGKDLTFNVAYYVADPSDISMDVTIIDPKKFESSEVTFVS
ncbi:DUF308 domain-containing protein [Kocuria massiliensis]|uniref:DUF308 domain-containing protein n=1 Tax=Kocuria massiliensis TaxID=1926282 RepID=UPI0022B9C206|nr:DUF308 domain-containing protein [Kocuria massiliensis]